MGKIILQGFVFGLAYVAPIGTQNLYVINSATQRNIKRIIMTTFFVIFFDISLAITCYLGIGLLLDKYIFLRYIIMLLGAAIIVYIAISLLKTKVTIESNITEEFSIRKTIIACFSVTWLNPQAIIDGSILLGGFRSTLTENMSVFFIAGVCFASTLWFSFVAFMVHRFAERFRKAVRYIYILCALVLLVYGAKLLYMVINDILFHF